MALGSVASRDGAMVWGSKRLQEIADEAGGTPFYAYDSALIRDRVAQLREHIPPSIDIHFAVKANPMPGVVALLVGLVDGLDVASGGELKVALSAGGDPDNISFAGPGKRDDELRAALEAGITINLESVTEMRRLAALAKTSKNRPPVAIRVNPDFELKSSGMKMSGGPKQFGVDAEAVPEMLIELAHHPLRFVGFHIFSGSQNLNADAIIESQGKALDLAVRLAEAAPDAVRVLNIGGGLGIPYFANDVALDLKPIGESLRDLSARAAQQLPDARLVIELGRYLVGEAGIYVCKVLDIKRSRGHTFLITDGGLHHHLAASGNFGQVIRKNYPVLVGTKVGSRLPLETVSVVGPLCTPLDVLAERIDVPTPEIGDLVVVMQSGAYGLTASPLGFLSHPHPGEILL